MRGRLRDLRIEELVVHDVPKKLSQTLMRDSEKVGESPVYSDIASPVNAGIKNFFFNKISSTIGSTNSVDVVVDPDTESPVPELVRQYLTADEEGRIKLTQDIASFLYEKQTAQNSAGLLLFLRCIIDEAVVLAILKVEREEGVRVKQQTINTGLLTFDIEHIHDLMLTAKTKLFKIAFFGQRRNLLKVRFVTNKEVQI